MITVFELLSHTLGIHSVASKTALHLSLVKIKYWKLLSFRTIKKKKCSAFSLLPQRHF